MSIFEKSFKKDLENFEYDSRDTLQDHKWDRLASGEETKKFYDAKERINMSRVKRNRVQSDPETTGQHSPID
jgi:hypothetical protein